ncbi:unnamed protein product [Musa textilis]
MKTRYSNFEKMTYGLVSAARKLCSYFSAHHVIVMTDQPMCQILSKPVATGRLIKWIVGLSEFDISNKPRTTIKAQALVDFMAEMTLSEEVSREARGWTLHIDGRISKLYLGRNL